VIEAIVEVHARRARLSGVEIVTQPESLRHFSATFRPAGAPSAVAAG